MSFQEYFAHVQLTHMQWFCLEKESRRAFGFIPSSLGVIFTSERGILNTGMGEARRKRMCVYWCAWCVCVRVHVCACKSSLVHSAGNSCRQDFLFCTGNKMAENGRPETMLWKSASTQVREQGVCESEGRKLSRTRSSTAAGTTCWKTFPPVKFKELFFHSRFHIHHESIHILMLDNLMDHNKYQIIRSINNRKSKLNHLVVKISFWSSSTSANATAALPEAQ